MAENCKSSRLFNYLNLFDIFLLHKFQCFDRIELLIRSPELLHRIVLINLQFIFYKYAFLTEYYSINVCQFVKEYNMYVCIAGV